MEDKYYSRLVKVLIFLIDFYFIQIVFTLLKQLGLSNGISDLKYTSFFLIFSLIWVIAGFFNEIYRINRFSGIRKIILNVLATFIAHVVFLFGILIFVQAYHFSINFFISIYALTIISILLIRAAMLLIWKYIENAGRDHKNFIIIGATRSGKALYEFFLSHDFAPSRFKGFFDNHPERALVDPDLIKGKISEVQAYCLKEEISEIYYALPLHYETMIKNLSKFADDNFIYLRIVPDFSKTVTQGYNIFLFDSIPVFTPRNEPLGISINVALKRVFDIAFSLFVICFIFPFVVPFIALAIRLDSKGPIIFKQPRRGKKNRMFECYKFRTMKTDCRPDVQATRNDPRVTRVGRFLRKTNLDELPQFVNVLLGNMSVVGPRPHISKQDAYANTILNYKFRYFVTPGITGYAQVNGYRGETKEQSLMEKRVEYDVKYMESWSLSLDIKIILMTVWNMLKGQKNAY